MPSAYEMEKVDEQIAKDEKRFFLVHLHIILVWLLFDKIKEIIK